MQNKPQLKPIFYSTASHSEQTVKMLFYLFWYWNWIIS